MTEKYDEDGTIGDRTRVFINKTLLGLLCGSLGFGLSQLTIASDVRVHSTQILNLRESFLEERQRTDARIFEMVAQMKEQIKVNVTIIQQSQQLISQNDRTIALLAALSKQADAVKH